MQSQRTYADNATHYWFKRSNEQARKYVGNKYFQLLKLITPYMHKTDPDLIDKMLFALINHRDLGIKDTRNDIYEAKVVIFRYFAIRVFNGWSSNSENSWMYLFDDRNEYPGSSTDPVRTRIMDYTMCGIQKLLAKAKVNGYEQWKAKWDSRDEVRNRDQRRKDDFMQTSIYKFFSQLDGSYHHKLTRKELHAAYKTFCAVNGCNADSATSFGKQFYPHGDSSPKATYIYGKDTNGNRTKETACILTKESITAFLEHMEPEATEMDTIDDFEDGYMTDHTETPIIGYSTHPMRFEDTIEYYYQQNPNAKLVLIEQPEQPEQPIEQAIEQPIEQAIEQPIEQAIEQPIEQSESDSDARDIESMSDSDSEYERGDDSDAYASDDDFYKPITSAVPIKRTHIEPIEQLEEQVEEDSDSDFEDAYDSDDEFYKPIASAKILEFAKTRREQERAEFLSRLSKDIEYDVRLVSEAKRELRA